MDGDKTGSSPSPLKKASKFAVYQNPTFSAALTANSLRPSTSTVLRLSSLSSAAAFALIAVFSRENGLVTNLKLRSFSQETAYFLVRVIEAVAGLLFLGATFALVRTVSLLRVRTAIGVTFKETKDQLGLTNRQLGLMGVKPKTEQQTVFDSAKKPPKSKPASSSSDVLVPLHQTVPGSKSNRSSRIGSNRSSPNLVPGSVSPLSSPGFDSPWSSSKQVSTKEIRSEERLEQFLAEVDERISAESAAKMATPPPTIRSFGAGPSPGGGSGNLSAARSTPLRQVRMSPGSKNFKTPPKKGEAELPPAMSMEESAAAFDGLGVNTLIEQWRDRLRQWFSSALLNPLLNKIETSHVQVMQSAAKLGISVTVSQVGSDLASNGSAAASSMDRNKEWQPTITLDEDEILHQLRSNLLHALDSSTSKTLLAIPQQSPQQNPMFPVMQECVDAISEHQKLQALMKGEWVKGLLPQSSIRADYAVQRIRELAEGTCLKNFEYLGNGEVYDSKNKKWSSELPTDSHLLLYLFCAFLEHPKWMLHVDPTTYAGSQSSKNPLFLGVLPPKERFPEKYVAIISGVPSVLHPGACVLAVGRQSPPIFALYWDKKSQFSLQGRTALWDSILLVCHRIKVSYGGIIRGLHIGSPALSILGVLNSEAED